MRTNETTMNEIDAPKYVLYLGFPLYVKDKDFP